MSSIPTMQEIINLYLYGEKNIPENLLNPEIVNRPLDATTTINVDMNEFMRYSAGRYVHPANFLAVRKFLLGEYDSKLSAGTYNTEQFFDAIGVPKNPESRSLEVSNYTLDTSSSDYLDRSYVFGSMSFRINKDAKFIVEEDGSRYIKNIAVEANNDNFDYKSDNFFALVTNSMTEGIIDPFKIGRKVHINFVGNNSDVMDLGEGHIRLLFSHINFFDSISSPIPNIPKLIEGLYSITKGLNYIDKDGNLIVYGSQENDGLTYHKAILLNYIFGNINTFNSNISFVGGNNFDTILGGSKNDIILGNDGTDVLRGAMGDDTLIGGLDVDTLYGGDNDDTLIGGMSEDDPTDNNAQNELYGEAGNDTLKGSGRLEGGVGFDKYYAYDTAIIKDEDGKGEVYLAVGDTEILLTGGVRTSRTDDTLYESSDGSVRYVWNKTANTLTINDTLTLENWKNGELGIRLAMGHDIAFIIDVSGSMKDDMQTIVGSIDRVADALFYATPASQDNRIAVATYETNTTILQKFTNHETTEGRVSAFKEAMAKVPAMVQGGVEHVYQAIYDVLIGKAGAWRQDADTRTIFVFGDEPGDDRHLKPMVDSLANNLGYTVNNFTRSATRSVGGASLASYRIALSDTRTNNEMSENSTSQNSSLSVVVNTISIGNHSLTDLVNQINNTSYYSVGIQDIVDVLILALNDLTMSSDNVLTVNSENDILNGKHGNDKLYGDNGNNTLNGDSGDDVLRGGSGNDTLNGGQGNDFLEGQDDNDTLYGNEGDDTLYGGDGDDVLDGGAGSNILDGGNGYDSYRVQHSVDTIIRDSDYKGNIFLDANVTNAQYHHHHVWNGGNGSFASLVPDGKIISETQTGNTIKYTKQYTAQTSRVPEFIFNPAKGTFTLHKNGTSFNTNFSEYTDGFDYLKFDNIFNYDDINNLQEMDVTLSSIPKFTYSNAGALRYEYNFIETKLSMRDFINQGTVKAIYGDNDDVIEGISEHNEYWSVYAYDANENSISPYRLLGFDNHKKPNGDFYDDVNPDLFTGIITGDVVFAGAGNDKINTGKGASVIFAGSGDDYIVAPDTAGIDKVYGQTGNDTIYLYDPTGVIVSEKSKYPYIHTDEVYGGEGDDKIYGNEYVINGKIFGNEGDDHIELKGFMATVSGDDGDDVIILEKGATNISAGKGNDRVYVKSVEQPINTSLDAGEGDDVIEIQGHLQDVRGGSGNDVIIITTGDVYGEEGDDSITINSSTARGGDGNDTIIAKNGNVTLDGGAGADTLIGGLGDDTYIVDEFDTYLEEAKDLEGGYDTIHIASDFDLSVNNFEAVTLLGDGNFNVIGDEFDNIITGNIGNNHLMGGAGNDTISGGDGNDHLDGGQGIDILTGGLGNDYYILDNEFDTITEYFDEGIDTLEQHTDRPFYNFDELGNPIKTGSYSLLFDNIENLILKGTTKTAFGNHLDNVITLNEHNNFVNALAGNDTIIYQKGGGKDTILSTDNLDSKDSLVIEGYDLSEASFVRVTNTASAHDMLQIRFKGSNDQITLIDYFAPSSQKDDSYSMLNEYGEWVSKTTTIEQDNKIDQISFKKGEIITTLSQSEFEAKIIAQSQNTAPKVNKYPKPVTAHIGKELLVQFDKDTIKDADPYDSELSYRITLTTKNSQGQYESIPEWLSFDPVTLTLKGTPPEGAKGNLQFILWGEDSFNYSAGAYVNLSVVNAPSTDTTTTPKPTNPATPTTPQTGNLVKDTKGNDTLKGDGKDTTFVYTGGSDTLTDTGGKDTLVFGNGITFNQVGSGLMQSGNDLVLRVNGSTANQITLKNFFADQSSIIETIKFETGGQIDYKQIYGLFGKTIPADTPAPLTDTTTPATPSVSPQNNFVGTNRADKLTGTDGNDQLQGLAGADTLTGNAGNDILIGGTGNDTLMGGAGNDLYYFAKGFGRDIVVNTGGGYDNIYFDGISFNQVGSGLVKSGNNLILKVKGTTDELTLKDFFLGGDNASLNIHFKDGGSISNTQLLNAFKSTKTPTHSDSQGFNASLEIALGLMEEFRGLNGGVNIV